VDYNIKLPQNKASTSTATASKAEASTSFKGFGFFKTLNTTWFNMFMVLKRLPVSDTTMEVEPLEKATHAESTPVEASHAEATPMEEASEEATPIEDRRNGSHAESVRDRRPQPVDNVVERQIGGKVFKLGRSLSLEEQYEVAAMISRHLDAFAWTASDMPGIDPDFLCHHLTMDAKVRPVRQRRRKFNEERCLLVKEETQKLLSAGHIREIQYPK